MLICSSQNYYGNWMLWRFVSSKWQQFKSSNLAKWNARYASGARYDLDRSCSFGRIGLGTEKGSVSSAISLSKVATSSTQEITMRSYNMNWCSTCCSRDCLSLNAWLSAMFRNQGISLPRHEHCIKTSRWSVTTSPELEEYIRKIYYPVRISSNYNWENRSFLHLCWYCWWLR